MLSIHDPLLIFTDLDGTLLNSHTFSGSPRPPGLHACMKAACL